MLVLHATQKLRERVKTIPAHDSETSTTALGDWYGTAVLWRPQVCLFVNEATLLPLLTPLAPAAKLVERFADGLSEVLVAHGAPRALIEAEMAEIAQVRLAKTSNRSVVGIMNEFIFLAEAHIDRGTEPDLFGLSMRLAGTPCGPLYKRHISPDRELAAVLSKYTGHGSGA